jgi:hypothetical protein
MATDNRERSFPGRWAPDTTDTATPFLQLRFPAMVAQHAAEPFAWWRETLAPC